MLCMQGREFRSVLAHEYGHFSNRDTAGGGFALAVRRSLYYMAVGLVQGGAAAWYNPAWLFFQGFQRVFRRISEGASRLQEILADRWATFAYGAEAFEEGLRHVIERSIRFDANAGASLKEAVEQKVPLVNLYAHRPQQPPDEAEVARAVEAALQAPSTAYDSHPAPSERLTWIRALAAEPGLDDYPVAGEAWDLLSDRHAIELRMTEAVRTNIRLARGVTIPAQEVTAG